MSNRSLLQGMEVGKAPCCFMAMKATLMLRQNGDTQVTAPAYVPKSSACKRGSPGAARLLQGFQRGCLS